MSEALPSIESTGGRAFWFEAGDGTRLRGAAWESPPAARRGTALLLGGRTEFIEKNLEATEALLQRGFAVWSLDWRGQGLSERALADRHKGHIEDYRRFIEDLALLLDRHVLPAAQPPLVLVAHSMGGHISLRFLHDRPEIFACAAFSAPMVDIRTEGLARFGAATFACLGGLPWLEDHYLPGTGPYGERNRRFEGNVLTSDPERFARMHAQIDRNPELALGGPTFGWLHATYASVATLGAPDYARRIETPLLIASAGEDRVVDSAAQEQLCANLPKGRFVSIEGARHELLIEADPYRLRFWQEADALFATTAA